MTEPFWDKIRFLICKIIGHKKGVKWIFGGKKFFKCNRCFRVISNGDV